MITLLHFPYFAFDLGMTHGVKTLLPFVWSIVYLTVSTAFRFLVTVTMKNVTFFVSIPWRAWFLLAQMSFARILV
jgi:hypothetical protein